MSVINLKRMNKTFVLPFLALAVIGSINLPCSAADNQSMSVIALSVNEELADVSQSQPLSGSTSVDETTLKGLSTESKFSEPKKLEDYLTYKAKGKVMKSVKFFAGYRGTETMNWDTNQNNEFHSRYKLQLMDVGISGDFAGESKSNFKITLNPVRSVDGYNTFKCWISDVYVSSEPIKNNRITLGNQRPPIGVEGSASSYTQPFVNRSQIARTFGDYRAVGVKLNGNYKYADYNIGLYDATRNLDDFFNGSETTNWVNIRPFANFSDKIGTVTLGGGLSTGWRGNSYTVAGTAASWQYKRLRADFEYAHADGYNAGNYNSKDASGYYTSLAYKITPKVELLGRYDHFNGNLQKAGKIADEYSAGVNWYLKGNNLKLAANYVFRDQEDGTHSNRILISTQFMI